jgi:hypothetical protein
MASLEKAALKIKLSNSGHDRSRPNHPLHQTSSVTIFADAKTAPPAAGERHSR